VRQAQDQFGELFRDRWPPRRSGLAPLSRDHPAVPGEQGRRSDDPVRAQGSGQAPGQRGNDRAVGPVEPRFRVAPAKYGDLVPEHQQFGVLRRRGPGEQRQPPNDADEDQVHQPKPHDKQSCERGAPNDNAAHQRPRASYGTRQVPPVAHPRCQGPCESRRRGARLTSLGTAPYETLLHHSGDT
jgi:hypothetical protein